MPTTAEFTTEDQIVTDLVAYWTANLPTGLTAGTPIIHFRQTDNLPIPAVIIGHEGKQREKAKGMTGTAHVNLRIAVRTDVDVTDSATHRAMASAIDRAITGMATEPGPLALTYLHAIMPESPDTAVQDRRQITVLQYTAVATRCSPA